MKELITLTYWRQGHPLPVESASDFYYVNLARHLYNTICATEIEAPEHQSLGGGRPL